MSQLSDAIMGNDELEGGCQLKETKFTRAIFPRDDEGSDVKDEEKFDSAKSSLTLFDFQSPPIADETPLTVILQLQSKLW